MIELFGTVGNIMVDEIDTWQPPPETAEATAAVAALTPPVKKCFRDLLNNSRNFASIFLESAKLLYVSSVQITSHLLI